MTYSDGAFAVNATTTDAGAGARVTLSKQAPYGEIRYTLDGSEPTARSVVTRNPLAVARAAAPFARRRSRVASACREFARFAPTARSDAQAASWSCVAAPSRWHSRTTRRSRAPRAVFSVDIQNPCWIYRGVDFDRVHSAVAAVGQLPFNFRSATK